MYEKYENPQEMFSSLSSFGCLYKNNIQTLKKLVDFYLLQNCKYWWGEFQKKQCCKLKSWKQILFFIIRRKRNCTESYFWLFINQKFYLVFKVYLQKIDWTYFYSKIPKILLKKFKYQWFSFLLCFLAVFKYSWLKAFQKYQKATKNENVFYWIFFKIKATDIFFKAFLTRIIRQFYLYYVFYTEFIMLKKFW